MATEEDKTNSGALLTLVAVATFAMIAVTLAVTAIARDEMGQAQEAKEGPGADQYHELRRSQQASLANGVSIEQSMQNVVQGLARDPNSATPPAPASTAAAPAAAGGASAGGASAGGASAGVNVAGGAAAGGKAAAEKAAAPAEKPAAPSAKPAAPPAVPGKPLAPQPAPGQPSPAAPSTPPHG